MSADGKTVVKGAKKAASAPARKTTAKRASVQDKPEAKPAPEPNLVAAVGDTVEIEVDDDANQVVVERPDGSEVTVYAAGGRALYVLDLPGVHVAGGLVVDAQDPLFDGERG